ncbi:putative xanthine/uracil/vitamin C permease [Selenomonas ruminantium subsp. lactilytica TAM6421]|uniref:Putative xanthine/uracil/vitamin C permease n=1 Tax=Selenomonas ruminantium subsp. lactilytica (strain NBRC 103574 / TAM6421) TaxID=927704 RepID=I0GM39_SELRL|nr:nucleobase:cation symporter-2 family protein [Selenomonas ruminantium]BAL81826.1 putative xanthine/uracil/vitamin C permease [Selenomonas ruminantium subsp. lactilytica TAM6421]
MKEASIANIYQLDGRVPLGAAIPFGLQHVLAMFVANLTPIVIIAGAAGFDKAMTAMLVQNAMFVAGIATLVQLYPLWKVGARLPIVMGVSFTFVTAICFVAANFGYGAVVGAIIVGGIFEGTLGLMAKYWRRLISPIVSSIVVTTIGFSLLGIGIRSFGGGYNDSYGSLDNLLLGTVTLVTCLLFSSFAKGYHKQLSVLVGLVVGYVLAFCMGKINLSAVFGGNIIALPNFLPVAPEFHLGAIFSIGIIFLVSAAETIGDTTAMAIVGLKRDVREREISGSLACDGFCSSVAALFGCSPITSFSQNVGLIAMTKVVNRFAIMTGAMAMIIAGLFPPIGAFFASLPDAVLGGCTIMMFGSIMVSGIQMMSRVQMTQRNVTIAALSFSIGIGTTTASENAIWHVFPQLVQDVFSGNCVAVVYVVAILLDTFLPANMEVAQQEDEEEVLEPAIDNH